MRALLPIGAILILMLSGCSITASVKQINPIPHDLKISKKYPLSVALIVPTSTQDLNTISIDENPCNLIKEFSKYPYGDKFKEVAIGTFSQLFDNLEVVSNVPVYHEYDFIIEANLNKIEFKVGCRYDKDDYFKGIGSLKIISGEYNEKTPVYQGEVKREFVLSGLSGMDTIESDISILLSNIANKYSQELIGSPYFLKIAKNKNGDQYASKINSPPKTLSTSELKDKTKAPLNFKFPTALASNPDSVAVIIGNHDYTKGAPNVDFALNDADLVRQFVINSLGYREGNVIVLRNATQADLISVFGNKENYKAKLFNWLRPGKSEVFVYYSGHGVPSLATGQGYLLPVDADPSTVEFNGYPLETLYANLGKLPAKSITVVLDACFSGNSQAGMVVTNASPAMLRVVEVQVALPNSTVMTAAGVSEVASWDQEARVGLFTRHFLEGVTGKADKDSFGNNDGKVTLGELKGYLESEVTYMARRLYMREQHPQVSGSAERILSTAN